jgi:hypothetical protein
MSSSTPGEACPVPVERFSFKPRMKMNLDLCTATVINPICPVFSITVGLKGEAPNFTITRLDKSTDTKGIIIELNGKPLESITFPFMDVINDIEADTIINIKFNGKICHSETISSDLLKLKASVARAAKAEAAAAEANAAPAAKAATPAAAPATAGPGAANWNPKLHVTPEFKEIKVNFEGVNEYSYKLSIRSFEDPSNSQVINVVPVDKSFNENRHTIVARNLQPNTLYTLFIVAELNGEEVLRSNELSIKTKDSSHTSYNRENGEWNNNGSEGGENEYNNGNENGNLNGNGYNNGNGNGYNNGNEDNQSNNTQNQDPFGQSNAPGPFVKFFSKSTFSLDKAGKSSVSNGTPGILRMDEFKERFVINDTDLDRVREVFILYWFVPSLYGKEFTPISNPYAEEYRAPCNSEHRELLKNSFGKYVDFLKRKGAEKPQRSSEEDSYAIELERVKLYLTELNKKQPSGCISEGEAKSKIHIGGPLGGKGNYYKFLPDMFYLAYMQAKKGDGANLNAQKIFDQYSEVSSKSVDELLDQLKKDGTKSDDFDHNISAGLLRLLTFLQEKYPKIYNKIVAKGQATGSMPHQPLQRGGERGSYSKMFEPIVKQESAWRKLNSDYYDLPPNIRSVLPPPPKSPIIETVEPLRKYIDKNADNEPLNEARSAVDLLAPDDVEELMRSDTDTSPMSRIKPYYQKALPGIGTPWVPIMVRADVLSRVLKNRT